MLCICMKLWDEFYDYLWNYMIENGYEWLCKNMIIVSDFYAKGYENDYECLNITKML